jgi:hypothetical protein
MSHEVKPARCRKSTAIAQTFDEEEDMARTNERWLHNDPHLSG